VAASTFIPFWFEPLPAIPVWMQRFIFGESLFAAADFSLLAPTARVEAIMVTATRAVVRMISSRDAVRQEYWKEY
jgi:hypothetical protein